jgi:P4 family phage/plasmid primase-like protien
MVAGWPTDRPAKRHNWLVSQATRLACAHRLGRITESDYAEAAGVLDDSFLGLLAEHGEPRAPMPANEVPEALKWGVRKAASFTDERAAEEVGGAETGGVGVDVDVTGTPNTPATIPGQAKFTDAGLAQTIAAKVLRGKFLRARGVGWLHWTGTHWRECGDGPPTEAVRRYVIGRIGYFARRLAANPGDLSLSATIASWKSVGSRNRITSVLALAGNIVEVEADALDADPDLLNTPGGIVDLTTGVSSPHDPARLMTKITRGSYRPGYTHPDVDKALDALPEPEREWLQRRVGQGITGHMSPDGVVLLLQGSGENGKSALTTGGLFPALGGYAHIASSRLFSAEKGNDNSTERADLRGRRLVIGEELTEGRALDVTAIKRMMDTPYITARRLYQDKMTFSASHTLIVNTNHRPLIDQTDHGTWRRLALLVFLYTFVKRPEDVVRDTDRIGDPTLKQRIAEGADGQHDALVTWAVQGAMAWYADPATALLPTERVAADTLAWRAETDRILGYWTERLTPDPVAKILATDLLADFNMWLTSNGHREWSKETFAPRFADHLETTRHGVERRQLRNLKGLSRPPGAYAANTATGGAAWVWMSVRFRRAEDEMVEMRERFSPFGTTAGGAES